MIARTHPINGKICLDTCNVFDHLKQGVDIDKLQVLYLLNNLVGQLYLLFTSHPDPLFHLSQGATILVHVLCIVKSM